MVSSATDDGRSEVSIRRPSSSSGPPASPDAPDSGEWIFDGRAAQDKPAVPLSRGVVGGIVLAALALVTGYVVLASTAGAGPSRADQVYTRPSISQTLPGTTAGTPVSTPPPSSVLASIPPLGEDQPTDPVRADTPPADSGLQQWYDASGRPLVDELEALIDQIRTDIDQRALDRLAADCAALDDLSDEARSARPPGSETQIAADWDDAADWAAAAADDCVTAIGSGDEQLLRSALEQARRALVYAQEAIEAVENAV